MGEEEFKLASEARRRRTWTREGSMAHHRLEPAARSQTGSA